VSFHVHNLGLNEAIGEAVRKVGKRLYDGKAPTALHHYTRAETVVSIADSRSLWATCLTDQSDQSELLHAIDLVRLTAQKVISGGVPEFTAGVLRSIASLMEERRRWFFIACFCGNSDSRHHQGSYGNFCLRFDAPWMGKPHLTFPMSNADYWYQRVIYDATLQKTGLEEALGAVATALQRYTSGHNEGPMQGWMTNSCARIAAHQLLAIAVGFKREEFANDDEWRIVCCPRLNPLSSAPAMADDDFAVAIRSDVRRHIELTVPREYRLFAPTLRPAVPFTAIFPNRNACTFIELQTVREALRHNGREELLDPGAPSFAPLAKGGM
jgi:hypothetical protein